MKFVNSQEIVKTWGISRQRVLAIAKKEKWRKRDYDRPYWYNLHDVEKYIHNKDHTDRARAAGFVFRGLLRHDWQEFCADCPICLRRTLNT